MNNNPLFLSDKAITHPDDDYFNFKHYAKKIKNLIQLNADDSNPLVIGIHGKWGEGKTSFLNLIENQIDLFEKEKKGLLKYHFNPWRYSNEEEMHYDFFDGLSKAMYLQKNNLKKAGESLIKFSRYLKSLKISVKTAPSNLGPSVSFEPSEIFKALGEDIKGPDITLEGLADKVNEYLEEANYKIIVFIDDLDRLDKDEIYTLLKLIKLNANFKNFVYIITLDSDQVAKAIGKRYGEEQFDGKLFLEKIINIPIHLPRIEKSDLSNFFKKKLNSLFSKINFVDTQRKKDELEEVSNLQIEEIFNSPREILKVLNNFYLGSFAIGDEVNLKDLFWIEWLKTTNEELYTSIKNYNLETNRFFLLRNGLIDFNDEITSGQTTNEISGTRKKLLEKHPDYEGFINNLFPFNNGSLVAEQFEENLNVCSVDHFEKYFSYHTARKFSKVKMKEIDTFFIQKKEKDIKIELNKLFKSEIPSHRIIYYLENISKNHKKLEIDPKFLFKTLLDNIDLFPDTGKDLFGKDAKLQFIESIAKYIDKSNLEKEFVLECTDLLDIDQLCYFIRKFRDESEVKKDLEKKLISRVKKDTPYDNLFFKSTLEPGNRMIMYLWHKHYQSDFEKYIKSVIHDCTNLNLLIRSFVPIWNTEYHGMFEKNTLEYMKSLIDIDLIFEKLKECQTSLIESVDENLDIFDIKNDYSMEDSIKQFIYHYKKENQMFD